jgi:carbon-monoxide dehydrogenase large subunit
VRFQPGGRVRRAEDRYAARDALELIDVEYEPLPPVVDARRALDRTRRSSRRQGRCGKRHERQAPQPHLRLGGGRQGRTDGLRSADVVVAQDILYPRCIPHRSRPAARWPASTGRREANPLVQHPGPARAPDGVRQSPDCPSTRSVSSRHRGGFGNKVGIYPGYVCAIVGSIVTGHPVKWSGPLRKSAMSVVHARLTTCTARSRRPRTEDPRRAGRCAIA